MSAPPPPRPDFKLDSSWQTCRVQLPPEEIALISAILEAYDNQFLTRTESEEEGRVRIWYAAAVRPLLDEVLLDLNREFPVKVLSFEEGMEGLDEVIPE